MSAAQRGGLWCFCGFVAVRTLCVLWFLAHSEFVEAQVLSRREFGMLSRRGMVQVNVSFDRHGELRNETVRWQLQRPDDEAKIKIRIADSGVIRATPASLWETLWFETVMAGICVLIACMAFLALLHRGWSTRGRFVRR